jgi:carbon storage regulator
MLVLSRKLGQRIIIPNCDMTITIVAIDGNTVRLGITAPEEIGVYREELWQQIQKEQSESAAHASNGLAPAERT